ncbi:hypothetical protein FBUS_09365 [Fasciolopsis buskii]|uniref:FCP1 homology domain-containing protein n=1 Tax=Fasciolopsis buskii TaxID=27845 RepID=A0A8E0VKL8_9TREM|nr:hypothetical protein FBUS_09365 [Fasciolopsis buski]
MSPINRTMAALCSHLTPHYCQTHRKLILVCDMDETLLTEVQNGAKILLRPKVCYMLRSLRNLYEVCMVTYSTRDRTYGILKELLDPDGRIFGNRVLCREDIVPQYRNKLDAFLAHLPRSFGGGRNETHEVVGNVKCRSQNSRLPLQYGRRGSRARRPPVWTYVVALDDFPLAWSNLSTCIPIRPFLVDDNHRVRSAKNEGIYVLSLQKFLTKLHSAVFHEQRLMITQNDSTQDRFSADQFRLKNTSAYSVVSKLRRRPSQAHRFQALCHLDPGRLIDFDARREKVRPLHRDSIDSKAGYGSGTSSNVCPTVSLLPVWTGSNPRKVAETNQVSNTERYMMTHTPFSSLSSSFSRDTSPTPVSDETYSLGSSSNQLIRHVYRRAKLIRKISTRLSGY